MPFDIATIARPNPTNPSARPAKPLHLAVPGARTRHANPARHAPAPRAGLKPAAGSATREINPAKLEEVENRLLADAIEQHAQCDAALDGALEDMAVLSAELRRSRRRPLLLRSATNLNRVEDLLLEAIVRTHPNRVDALDRLLADVSDDDTAAAAEERARAAFDMSVDNDFDGMG